MKKLFIAFVLFSTSCSHSSLIMDSYGSLLTQKRQKQKIIVLQKKLETAEKQQTKIVDEVALLKEEIFQAELALIRTAVEGCEHRLASHQTERNSESNGLFLEEREMLHRMIQAGSSPASFEAQVVLDQILRIITNFSELK